MTGGPRIVVVGAGAVGSVYALLLSRAGAEVSFYVRPARRERLVDGVELTRVGLLGRRRPERFVPAHVVTSPDELRALAPDELWLATDSEALEGEWLGPLLSAAPAATIVLLAPGERAEAKVRAHVPEERLVRGLIGMIAWASPLAGSSDPRERTARGTSYLLATSRFSGREAAGVVARLRRGGGRAALDPDAPWAVARGSALLLPHVAALETVGWSFRRFTQGDAATLALAAAREMAVVAAMAHHAREPLLPRWLPAFATRVLARVAPLLSPFDVETYFRVHFQKVGAQTRHILAETVRAAAAAGLPHAALDALAGRLPPPP